MLLIALTYMMTSCLQLYCLVHSTDAITWVNWSRRMIEVCLTGEKSSNVNLSSSNMVMEGENIDGSLEVNAEEGDSINSVTVQVGLLA